MSERGRREEGVERDPAGGGGRRGRGEGERGGRGERVAVDPAGSGRHKRGVSLTRLKEV